ncbi:transmembrane amino acid transporter protein-domain-containing protein [Gongronella butleri]|nr:transmembrane amino acid transporter protein-domain-containing protein [Gongronella butleri]
MSADRSNATKQPRPQSEYIPRPTVANTRKYESQVHDAPNAISYVEEETSDATGARPRPRPKLSSRATSFAKMAKRKSMGARSYSSLSLYTHFAGEDFKEEDERKHKKELIAEHGEDVSGAAEKEEEEDEFEYVQKRPTASVGKALFMFLKAFIGSGVLFLPSAYQQGGIILSNILMLIFACICMISFLALVQAQLKLGGSYGEMGHMLYGQVVRYAVQFFIVISQIGFVCSYFIFVSGNFLNVANVLSHCTNWIEQKNFIWFPLIILVPLSLVRHLARLSYTAIFADIFILFGLIVIIYYTSWQLHNVGIGPNLILVNSKDFGMTISTAAFSFEGIGLLIPIVDSMEKPEKFPYVVFFGLMVVTTVYITIGTLSYLAYGSDIQAAVLYDFPPGDNLTIAVQLLYSLAIMLTMPLMLFPALKIIENGIFRNRTGRGNWGVKMGKNVFRCILCLVCALIAYGVGGENLDKFVSLVGSVACLPLCFIFPGMFHYKVTDNKKLKLLDIFLIVWGGGMMVYTLYVTINSWVHPTPATPAPSYCPT